MFPAAANVSPPAAERAGRILALRLLPGLLLLIATACASAAERAAPTRPGMTVTPQLAPPAGPALASRTFSGVEFVRLTEVAGRLGLRVVEENKRRITLEGPGVLRAVLEADEREALVNGLRVFLGNPVHESGGQLYCSRIDFERCLTPLLRPGLGVTPPPRPRVVVLDPGHGGKDNGMTNRRLGLNEKTFALDTALRLEALLKAAGYQVVLTRRDDTFVELAQRAAIANIARADLFLSIHFNALDNDSRTAGIEVFTFAPQHQSSSDAWSSGRRPDAESEPSNVNAFDHWSVALAQPLHRELLRELQTPDRGKKLMHLRALRPLKCPGVLVECGFLTSDAEARRIATPAYRQKIAEALCAGIRSYAATVESLQPRP